MKRKLLLFYLAVCMIIPTAAAAADFTDVAGTDDQEAVSALSALGIYQDLYEDIVFEPDKDVTRGEFAMLLANLSGYDASDREAVTRYTDVRVTDPYATAILRLTAAGVLSGNGDGTFGAENTVTFGEAVAGLVNALGYRPHAMDRGGYPAGYLYQANYLGLASGLNLTEGVKMTRGTMSRLIYNSLEVDIAKAVGFQNNADGEPENTYSVVKGQNVLTEYLKLGVAEGVVAATEETGLDAAENRAPDDACVIAGEVYRSGGLDLSAYLGRGVKAYYEKDDIRTLRYIMVWDTKETVILADDIVGFENRMLEYQEKDAKASRRIEIKSDADVIYNGIAYPDYVPEDFMIRDGQITLIDNNRDNKYEVVWITEYMTAVVSAVQAKDRRIYLDKPSAAVLDLKDVDEDQLTVLDKEGKAGGLTDLAADMVITVAASRDKSKYQIQYSGDQLNGAVTMVGEDTFEVDYIPRKVVPGFKDQLRKLGVDYAGTFLLDAGGRIAQVLEYQSDQVLYGYYCDYEIDDTFDISLRFRIYSQEGKMEELIVADKVEVDGVDCAAAGLIKDARFVVQNGGKPYPNQRMVKFGRNGRGELDYLVTSDSVSSTELEEDEKLIGRSLDGVSYKASSKIFSKVAFLTENTITFKVPMAPESDPAACAGFSEKAFSVNQLMLSDNQKYTNIEAFDVDEGGACKIVILKEAYSTTDEIGGTGKPAENDPCVFVTDIAWALDEDGIKMPVACLFEKGAVAEYQASGENVLKKPVRDENGTVVPDTYKLLDRGDIIRYAKNSDNKITGIELVYDSSRTDNGQYRTCSGEASGYDVGQVYAKSTSGMRISATCTEDSLPGSPVFDFSNDKLITWKLADVSIAVYDREMEQAQIGSVADLVTHKDSPGEGSIVVVHSKYYETREVLVIK